VKEVGDMNILMFGPNGSGKGTFGAILCKHFGIPQIETGLIFRENISQGTDLGRKAKDYIAQGALVPDDITIPMILSRLIGDDCNNGWLLDGFPRNITQAEAFWKALKKENIKLHYVIELVLDQETAKKRIMGRRLCAVDNNHPNNVNVEENKPVMKGGKLCCRVCGCDQLSTRTDDQDEETIDKRHAIYYDTKTGTLAAIKLFKDQVKVIEVNTQPGVKEISTYLIKQLS
jgi:adenylate kinase